MPIKTTPKQKKFLAYSIAFGAIFWASLPVNNALAQSSQDNQFEPEKAASENLISLDWYKTSSIAFAAAIAAPPASNAMAQTRRDNQFEPEKSTSENLISLNRHKSNLAQIAADETSLIVSETTGGLFQNHFIRGLGNSDLSLNAIPTVGYLVDGVSITNPVLRSTPLYDIEKIYVFKTPQSSITGQNASSGLVAINHISAGDGGPKYLNLDFDQAKGFNLTGAGEFSLADKWDFRFSGLYQENDYWGLDAIRGVTTQKIRISGIYHERRRASNNQSAGAQVRYRTNNVDAKLRLHASNQRVRAQVFGGRLRANVQSELEVVVQSGASNSISYNSISGVPSEAIIYGASLSIASSFAKLNVSSITGYDVLSKYDSGDFNGPTILLSGLAYSLRTPYEEGIDSLRQFSQEFRIANSQPNRMNWQAGLIYTHEKANSFYNYSNAAVGIIVNSSQNFENSQTSLYARVNYDLNQTTEITLSGRYYDLRKRMEDISFGPPLSTVNSWVNRQAFDAAIGINHSLSNNVSLFANLSHNIVAPNIQSGLVPLNPDTLRDEQVKTAEAGFRANLFGNKLRIEMALFNNIVENQHFTTFSDTYISRAILVARETVSRGIEGQIAISPISNLSLSVNFTKIDSKINDPSLATLTCLGANCFTNPLLISPILVDGNRLPNIPDFTATFGGNYAINLGANVLTLETNWAYRGNTNYLLYDSAQFSEKGFWQGDARATFEFANGKYEIALFAQNILNTEAIIAASDMNSSTAIINAPRLIGISGKVNF